MRKFLGPLENVPMQPVRWPQLPEIDTTLRQIQASAQPLQLVNGQPSNRLLSSNVPRPVIIVGLTRKTAGTNHVLTIAFLQTPGDPNFQKVNVHLRLGIELPVFITSGAVSPLTITVPKTRKPATILLQAEGNWGPHPIQNSPSRAINLS